MSSLDLETESAVERDRARVIGIDTQLQPPQSQPVVGEIQRRRQQSRADALALPVIADTHADLSDMRAARPREARQAKIADHLAGDGRHQRMLRVVVVGEALAPDLEA